MAKVDMLVHMPVSVMVGRSTAMDRAADLVKARVLAEASRHRSTGAFMRSIKVKKVRGRFGRGKQVTDRLIYSDDPAVLSIEYGTTRSDGTRVPGKHTFERALSVTGWLR